MIYKRPAKSADTIASAMVELARTLVGNCTTYLLLALQLAEDDWRDGIGAVAIVLPEMGVRGSRSFH
jgi:hypothetical protein